jgi:hypothetical protein
MTRPDVRQFQVALTGTRLATCTDEELLVRLKTRFKLSDAQGAAMLEGTRVVKRGIDAASARTLVAVSWGSRPSRRKSPSRLARSHPESPPPRRSMPCARSPTSGCRSRARASRIWSACC